jgi:hypothetical protein
MTVAAMVPLDASAGLDGAARVTPHRPVRAAAGPSPADLGHLLRILGGWESAAGQLVVVQRNSRQVRGPRAVGEAPPHRERACAAHLCRGLSAAGDGPEWTARNAQTWWTSWLLWRMPFGARPASLACSLCSRHARHQLPVLGMRKDRVMMAGTESIDSTRSTTARARARDTGLHLARSGGWSCRQACVWTRCASPGAALCQLPALPRRAS